MGRYFDAMTFGDGSGLWTCIPETRRCGWGVVSALFVDGVFRRRAAAHGPLPGNEQIVPLAELFAFMFYLRHAIPTAGRYTFVTDCAYVIDGFGKGRATMTNGWSAHPGMWRELFRIAEDIGTAHITLFKIAAHRRLDSALSPQEAFMIKGNSCADLAAKMGAKIHPHDDSMYANVKASLDKVKMVAKFITTAVMQHHEYDESVKLDRIGPDADRGIGITGWTPGRHLQSKLPNGSWRCKRCLVVYSN